MKVEFNKDKTVVEHIQKGLQKTGGYCPCKAGKKEENKCMCKEFRTLLNEATTLFNAINDAHDIFVDYYEQLKVKILNLEFSDNKNFPSKLIRLFHKFDKRLNVDIDEALYYKLVSAIKG